MQVVSRKHAMQNWLSTEIKFEDTENVGKLFQKNWKKLKKFGFYKKLVELYQIGNIDGCET